MKTPINEQEIMTAFENSYPSFSNKEKLLVLCEGLEARRDRYYINHTLKMILKELGFITEKNERPSKKGRSLYYQQKGFNL